MSANFPVSLKERPRCSTSHSFEELNLFLYVSIAVPSNYSNNIQCQSIWIKLTKSYQIKRQRGRVVNT